jgi:hypothetical protein
LFWALSVRMDCRALLTEVNADLTELAHCEIADSLIGAEVRSNKKVAYACKTMVSNFLINFFYFEECDCSFQVFLF